MIKPEIEKTEHYDGQTTTWFTLDEGELWENYPVSIVYNVSCSMYSGGKCKHCHSEKDVIHKRSYDGSTFSEGVYICPRVIVAYNEGQCCSTGVCLDCILEAEKEINKLIAL